jgi:hypothetical protein
MRYTTQSINNYIGAFLRELNELFGNKVPLDHLHELAENKYEEQFKVGMDSSTEFHTKFYDKYRSGWQELEYAYEMLIARVVAPQMNESFLYQKFPTMRFHIPNNVAVGAFHKDSDFNHPKGELNYVIPLTNSNDTASIWVESEVDKRDFEPMEMIVGQLIQFNGNTLTHGNKINETGLTRVSMDFRILPLSAYDESNDTASVTKGTKFKEGAYYKLFKK